MTKIIRYAKVTHKFELAGKNRMVLEFGKPTKKASQFAALCNIGDRLEVTIRLLPDKSKSEGEK